MSSEAKDLSLTQQEVQDLEHSTKLLFSNAGKAIRSILVRHFLKRRPHWAQALSPPVPQWVPLMDIRCSGFRSIHTCSVCSC